METFFFQLVVHRNVHDDLSISSCTATCRWGRAHEQQRIDDPPTLL
jgi:hypothetical protein